MNEQEQKQLHGRIVAELKARDDLYDLEVVTGERSAHVYFRGSAKPQDVYAALNFNPAIERPKSCTLRVFKQKATP